MNVPHIVIIGAGFGGLNMAKDFHDWNLSETRVILLEANDHLITPYPQITPRQF